MAVKNYTYDRAELRLFGPVENELAEQEGLRPDADIARTRVVDLHRT